MTHSSTSNLYCVCMLLTKVGQFQLPAIVDQEILRLEVSVKDFTPVTIVQTSQQLKEEELRETRTQVRTASLMVVCSLQTLQIFVIETVP